MTSADVVEMPGQYALRGGILDVYSPEAERPVRIEFFGDEVESIRRFDPATQRSSNPIDEALLLPLTETPVQRRTAGRDPRPALGQAHHRERRNRRAGGPLRRRHGFPGWEFYAPVAGADRTVFDLLPHAAVLLDEPDLLRRNSTASGRASKKPTSAAASAIWSGPSDLYLPPDDWWQKLAALPGADLEHLGITRSEDATAPSQFSSQPTPRFHGAVPAMLEEVQKLTAEGKQVSVRRAQHRRSRAPGRHLHRVQRLVPPGQPHPRRRELRRRNRLLRRRSSHHDAGESLRARRRRCFPTRTSPSSARAICLTSPKLVASRPQRQKSKVSAFLSDFRDLQVGDYVVHVEHGIGQYQGLKEINQGDGNAEFMLLEYAEGARLYVPLTRLDLIQKYRSSEGAKPALSHLGTQAWAKTKARVRKAMKDMADELLKLYARAQDGARATPFPRTTNGCSEFEDAFEFNETEDQAQAIADVKRDMESTQPMDRLLCGDVGYGKTEVAMRAAFKARQRQQAGRGARAHHRARLPALRDFQAALRGLSRHHRDDQPLPHRRSSRKKSCRRPKPARSTS